MMKDPVRIGAAIIGKRRSNNAAIAIAVVTG
jgi:hypothetical protein